MRLKYEVMMRSKTLKLVMSSIICSSLRKGKFIRSQPPDKRDCQIKPNIYYLKEESIFIQNIIKGKSGEQRKFARKESLEQCLGSVCNAKGRAQFWKIGRRIQTWEVKRRRIEQKEIVLLE